jgi:phosphoglycerate dehydrogenase-like enzyme
VVQAGELTDAAGSSAAERPTLTVLHGGKRPPLMESVEAAVDVRYTEAGGLADALRGADALFMWDFLSDALQSAWPAADQLRWLHIASAGVDKLLFPGLVRSDVVLTNSRGIFEDSIAEYVLGLVLAFAKDFPGTLEAQRKTQWLHRESERIVGRNVLIAGTGPIGRSVARMLRAVGMKVTGIGRTKRTDDPDFGVVHPSSELAEHLPAADYVVALAPLTEQTKGMFDAAAFRAMPAHARLINVGRGALVVTEDLVAALRGGELAGAALDVFEEEPLESVSPLWSMGNVMVSPHMSGDFIGWRDALAELFVDNFSRWRVGSELRNVVDKGLGYVPTT